jgi:tight adherence protein C
MALILIFGVALFGITVVLVGRAVVIPRLRAAEAIDEISAYGFGATGQAVEEIREAEIYRHLQAATAAARRVAEGLPGTNLAEIRAMLLAAGLYETSPAKIVATRVLGTVGLSALWLWIGVSAGKSPVVVIVGLIVVALAGWMLPIMLLKRKVLQRLEQIDYEMPDLIDTLVTTVEAGVALGGSLQIAARRIRGPLGEELRLLLQEQNLGAGMRDALQHLLERADSPAMRSFVRAIIQGELLGVSVGESLRTLSTEMRARRRATAEERAQKAPIKMLFPLAFLIFPAIFIVLLGPIALNLHSYLGH